MPAIVDYPVVLNVLESDGLRCNYFNSGSFGLATVDSNNIVGWLAGDDPTVHTALRQRCRLVAPPAGRSLAGLLSTAWQRLLAGSAWLMPASHWAYELQFGNSAWLGTLLAGAGIDPAALAARTDGSAIEFAAGEADVLRAVLETIIPSLRNSDFTLAFPGRRAIATLHHHQQIWWQSDNAAMCAALLAMA
jgi:hypothetical protein